MKRIIGIIAGIAGSILTAWVIAVVSGVNMFSESVNVIGNHGSSGTGEFSGQISFKALFIAAFAGILLIVLSYFLLFRKKK